MQCSTPAERLYDSLRNAPGRWMLLLVAVPFLLRLWFVGTVQLGLVQDEAQYWDWTRQLQLTYYSKGPLIAWIIKACTSVLGDTELGVRMGSLMGMAAFPMLVWWLVGRVWRQPAMAVLAVFVITVSPLFQALGILMTTDNPFVLCWMLSMLALYAASSPDDAGKDRGLWPFALLALAYGVGILAKYTMLGLAGLAVVHGLLLQRRNALPPRYWPRRFLALALGACLGFCPPLSEHAERLCRLQACAPPYWRVRAGGKDLVPAFPRAGICGAQFGFALPWWFWLMLVAGGAPGASPGEASPLPDRAASTSGRRPCWPCFSGP